MTVVTLDSNNLDAILQDAGIEPTPEPEKPKAAEEPAKPEEATTDQNQAVEEEEDENGLTPDEKKELTVKMQKAIGKRHRQMREAEEFAAHQYSERKLAEERAKKLEEELAAARAQVKPPEQPKAPQEPKPEDFQNDKDYLNALVDFRVSEGMRKEKEEQEKARQQREQQEILNKAGERINKAKELVPDFAETISQIDTAVPPVVAGYMQESEMFAELGYYLAKHPDELLSLSQMKPAQQLVKIGKIEATLTPFGPKAQKPHGEKPSKPDGEVAKPTPSDDGTLPSKARSTAPVITPLGSTSKSGVPEGLLTETRDEIRNFAKTRKVDFTRRKRH